MNKNLFLHAVFEVRDEQTSWDGDFQSLDDEAKDQLIFVWLCWKHSWLDDIFPHTVSDRYLFAMHVLYHLDSSSGVVKALFEDAAERRASDVDGDAYWSEAMGDFESILDSADLLDELKSRIHDYMEQTISDAVSSAYADIVNCERLEAGLH